MCMICDGATREEYLAHLHTGVTNDGFTVVGVEQTTHQQGWAYTIGLVDGAGHPELVAAHADVGLAGSTVATLARQVLAGLRFADGGETFVLGTTVGFRRVAPAQIRRGLLNSWLEYYDAAGRWELEPEALQVVLPDGHSCYQHQTTQPRLDTDVDEFLRPNRAMRRAMAREHARRVRRRR